MNPILPVNHYTRRWEKGKNRPYLEEDGENPPDETERDLLLLIQQVNDNLKKSHVPIHLGLVREKNGYALDIYDCTDGFSCKLIKDDTIHLQDLPGLLKNLQQKAGILIDLSV